MGGSGGLVVSILLGAPILLGAATGDSVTGVSLSLCCSAAAVPPTSGGDAIFRCLLGGLKA